MADIDRLIRALAEAQVDPTEEAITRCLGMARAVKAAHEQALVVAGDAAADEVWRERVDAHQVALQNLLLARADAERVRRGARCLRERCRRLEARVRCATDAASHAEAQAYAREAMAELAVSKLQALGGDDTMLSIWDDARGVKRKAEGALREVIERGFVEAGYTVRRTDGNQD